MIIQNISRKGPYCISIFKRALRTTSSVETYNFNLDNKMHTNGPVKVINVKYEKKNDTSRFYFKMEDLEMPRKSVI